MRWPYAIVPGEQPNPEYRGVLLLPPGGEAELTEGLRAIAAAGLKVQTHAVGDETIDLSQVSTSGRFKEHLKTLGS